ncbi:hypothetical protein PGUG_03195 [Meyerozyma guilliermondii ATCC 6260]|uniref:C2H2-type domain-containing protein n=1 Tax=Meyerozyma guilliermondii (strain ATCC 6260 / CBS 566 / DSM 6381 / JCM 1539 / NBRC 10279 / NRRL Y-324) TaxID=294746 RepID=A5DIU4_PICGU|nr:uncharacterized protein PGUG_03195 [Meyerozyma guilliermondii ATCC 6260]EDK39097.2 hypothetical protein PGUG_03195 [Meyerozyma guilliermondii ATCC 6260]
MLQVSPTKMEFSSEMNMGQDNSSVSAGTGSTKKKNIPVELTAYGTTPSGKPRLFVCQTCTRAFARLEHLRRHERSHTKEKPFSCGVCQRKFSRRDLLLRHAQKLHAGCADAITRLRRKSIKRNSSINDLDEYEYEDEDEDDIMDSEASGSPAVKDSKSQAEHSIQTPYDPVQFNLNLFSQQKQQNKPTPPRHGSVSSKEPGSLQRQVFDRKRPNRLRGASFSAQSGANYASGLPQFSESYPEADSVEFSTPQILATTTSDESYWFNNLSTIPGLSEHASSNRAVQMARANSDQRDIRHGSTMSLDSNSDFGMSHHGSVSQHPPNPHHRSDSMASSSSFNTFDSVNLQYMMPNATFSANEITPATTNSTSIANNPNLSTEDYGYAFYDVPETVIAKSESKPAHSLSPIEQEMDDDQSSNHTMQKEGNPSNNNNMDVNFLNDFGELTHDFDVNTRFMPGGYSFYDDNPSVSSSGMETNSPQVVSPPPTNGRYQTSTNSHLAQETTSGQDGLSPNRLFKPNSFAANNYNKNKLFTSNIRYMISKALSKYPISGVMTPTIPSNEKLEFYLNNFERTFLYHYPFIHSSKLNEYEIMSMTANEDPSSESARVCLPLLVATMGALLTNNKNDSEHLYEASRRTIHIYLESRKSTPSNGSPNGAKQPSSSNPLWLIQSLTLSVIYGLFSDNENNVYIVIRQLNALNSLVKSSIKTNRTILFSIHGEDEEIYNKTNESFSNEFLQNDLFSNSSMTVNDQVKFKNNIIVQSQNRIVFMIYRLTNFLLMMYNVPLTLSVNDLGSLEAPDVNDEFLWNFKTCSDYRAYCKEHLPNVSLDDMLNKSNTSKVPFKDLVYQFTSGNFNGQDYGELLSQRSRFEFISLLHGIFELKQYDESNSINVPQILDYLSPFIGQSKEYDDGMNKVQSALEQFDYALLAYFVKFTTSIDIKSLKEQSWIRNVEKLTNNYLQCLGNAEKLEDDNFLQVVDCCLLIIRYILFSTPEMSTGANFQALSLMDNAEVSFGSQILDDFGEIDSSRSCIHSQVLFHAFAVLSIFSIILTKRMNNNYSTETNKAWLKRFGIASNMMRRIETFLKMKYQSMKKENEISSLMLYSNGSPRTIAIENELAMHGVGDHHAIAFGMDKTLYILKIGELILGYLHDAKIKVSIFKKLSGNLSQIRKFLIDNESRIPTH